MTERVATAWLVLQLTGNGFDLAVFSAVGMLPMLFGGALAGVLVDRADRRRLLIGTQTAFTVLSSLLFLLILTHSADFWSILAISFLEGVVLAVDGPARQVYVLELVGGERLAGAVSLYEVILNASRVLGPALGGLLLVLVGPGACVLANALSFIAPLAVLLRYRNNAAGRPQPGRRSARGGARAGLRYAWSVPAIRSSLYIAAASCVIFNPSVVLPILAERVYHIGGGGYGGLLAAFGIGALPGAVLAGRGRDEPTGRQVRLLAAAAGLSMVLAVLAPDAPLLFLGMGVVGLTSIWMIARANTLVQLRSRTDMRGRVMGVWTMALPGTSPVWSLSLGPLVDTAGARIAYIACGLLVLAATALGWFGLKDKDGDPAGPDNEAETVGAAAVA